MISGIYTLNFVGTNKVYVGQTTNLSRRPAEHFRNLRAGSASKKLQDAYATYGIPSFNVVIECPVEELDETETEVIEIYNSVANGFNTLASAYETPTAGTPGDTHWNSKYTNAQIELVMEEILLGKYLIDISKELNISYYVIKDVANGTKHTWLSKAFPSKYEKMLTLSSNRSTSKSSFELGISYPLIESPEGLVYTVTNLTKFAKEHGLNSGGLYKLFKGTQKTCKGFKIHQT